MSITKQNIGKAVFILAALSVGVAVFSYCSGLVFFKLHHLPEDKLTVFTIWQYWQVYHNNGSKYVKITVNLCAFGPYILSLLGIFTALINKKQRSLHGDARFATLADVRKAGLIDPPKGLERTILVGKYKGHYLTYGGFQFVMLAAPTRSGKGVGVVIPNCLNYSDSLVVLDIKLENFDITSGFRKECGQEVYLFAPFDTQGRTHRYNPLKYISDDPAERIGDIDAIATALYSGGNENDKFWSENAKDLFRGLCLMVLEHPTLPKTLGEILRQASGKGKPFAEHIMDMISEAEERQKPFSDACRDALNRILNNSENTLAGIVATFNAPLLIFQNPRVDLATSDNDFDLRDVRRKRMTIYLGITPDKLKDAAVLVNLFFDQLLNLNTRVLPSQDKSLKYQCLLILDEFTAIGRVAMIQQSISYQAGYNMRVLTIIQNKSQLEDKYGKSGALTLMANHALMVMYAPSPVVQSDANEYSEMLGYQTVKSTNKSRSFGGGKGGSSRSESESEQRRALMLPQEMKELGQWREIVSLENCKPILCDKIKYFEDPAFTSRANHPTPDIPIQKIDDFIARIEDRRRDIDEKDLADPEFAEKVVGADNLPEIPENFDSLSEEETESILDDVSSGFIEAVAKTPIDVTKFRIEEDTAAEMAVNLFSGSEDDGSEDTGIELVSAPEPEAKEQSEPSSPISDDEKSTLQTLSAFGFTPQPSEDEEASSEEVGAAAEAEPENTPADQNTKPSAEQPQLQPQPAAAIPPAAVKKNPSKEEQESKASAEIQEAKALPKSQSSADDLLAAFGLESDDEKENKKAADADVLAQFGLAENEGSQDLIVKP